ncbi:40285_t:CDS:2 [Gigaspora margarita]|uniref:40285_t:CDS:1 n=1 Tax=Gigaspora margarita TaxID=4874 RepID=A0ABN7W1G7_GIGMA|nr:40285_t:CDS:2 [Gigaspora margarita]
MLMQKSTELLTTTTIATLGNDERQLAKKTLTLKKKCTELLTTTTTATPSNDERQDKETPKCHYLIEKKVVV